MVAHARNKPSVAIFCLELGCRHNRVFHIFLPDFAPFLLVVLGIHKVFLCIRHKKRVKSRCENLLSNLFVYSSLLGTVDTRTIFCLSGEFRTFFVRRPCRTSAHLRPPYKKCIKNSLENPPNNLVSTAPSKRT